MSETIKRKRQIHNYTSELELKTLLIRAQNKNKQLSTKDNKKINKYVKWFIKLGNTKHADNIKKSRIRSLLKERAIFLSENTSIDTDSYERFGEVILLMIKNILKKHQFSGYTYRDEFYSDSINKILKYMHNYNHRLTSNRTGQPVNSFAYISQIIHNSIVYIISIKNKEMTRLKEQIPLEINLTGENVAKNYDQMNRSTIQDTDDTKWFDVHLEDCQNLFENVLKIKESFADISNKHITIHYPKSYSISFEEYDLLKPHLKGISILRSKV